MHARTRGGGERGGEFEERRHTESFVELSYMEKAEEEESEKRRRKTIAVLLLLTRPMRAGLRRGGNCQGPRATAAIAVRSRVRARPLPLSLSLSSLRHSVSLRRAACRSLSLALLY